MWALGKQIRTQHNVTEGFGCPHCGFKHSSREVTRFHISIKHQEQADPPTAAFALAHYYRRRYQAGNPAALNNPDAAFWRRGGKRPECDANITPYNKINIIQHLRQHHHIVIGLNSTQLKSRHKNREIANLPVDVYFASTNEEDVDVSDIDEQEEIGLGYDGDFENGDVDGDQLQVDQISGNNEQFEVSTPSEGTTTSHAPTPSSMIARETHSKYLRDMFLSCLEEESIKDDKKALETNETRNFGSRQYRVHKDAPPDAMLNSKEIVCALLTDSGWHCEVPQCGATLDEPFAIDLHLEAHGGINLMEWYCGDLSCGTGSERVFNNREDFDSHIATEHQGSSYSLAALRRVPKREVLVACLAKWLRLEYTATQVASISISMKSVQTLSTEFVKKWVEILRLLRSERSSSLFLQSLQTKKRRRIPNQYRHLILFHD